MYLWKELKNFGHKVYGVETLQFYNYGMKFALEIMQIEKLLTGNSTLTWELV